MAKYRVIAASVNIHAGVLGLEPHQARARLHRVMYLGGNRYDVVGVSFKRGEEFEYEGELPKHLVESVVSCRAHQPHAEVMWPLPPDPAAEQSFPSIEPDLLMDVVQGDPDDGVSEMPPAGAKKRSRRKPAA